MQITKKDRGIYVWVSKEEVNFIINYIRLIGHTYNTSDGTFIDTNMCVKVFRQMFSGDKAFASFVRPSNVDLLYRVKELLDENTPNS